MESLQPFIEGDEDGEGAKGPPHNLDAEQAFLGGLLYNNELYFRVSDWLEPAHFYDPVHGRIYETARGMIEGGTLADAVTLKAKFDNDDGLAGIGGTSYLAVLIESAATGNGAVEYGRIVRELGIRRFTMDFADRWRETAASDADMAPGELIQGMEAELYALAETGQPSGGFNSFKIAIAKSLETTAAAYERAGGMSGIPTSLRELDELLGGLHPSDLIILAGRPSMGKTALACEVAFNVAKAYQAEKQPDGSMKTICGGVVGFYSLEMSEDQLGTRLISGYTGIPGFVMRSGDLSENAYREIADAAQEIAELPLFIDDTGGLSIGQLEARARRLKRTHGLDLLVIDYLQLVTTARGKGTGRVEEVSEVTRRLKALAKELNVPVIALSQLSRQVENRPDKKPQLSDLRESGSIEQDADVVLFVYREAYYKEREKPREGTPEFCAWEEEFRSIKNVAEVIAGKQRHGPIGTARLKFHGGTTKFSDLEGEA